MKPSRRKAHWKNELVDAQTVLSKIRPGMSIFLSTGVAEPRTLVNSLMSSKDTNLEDLELVQLVSLGQAISAEDRYISRYRLKTFFSGWIASDAITEGRVDLIPSRFSKIPRLIESGIIRIDAA
ncbi:MAG: GNAT family N-acetyltransferase, partial [Desulfobacteraceae bacterium 4484_190.3]